MDIVVELAYEPITSFSLYYNIGIIENSKINKEKAQPLVTSRSAIIFYSCYFTVQTYHYYISDKASDNYPQQFYRPDSKE